MGRQVFRKVSRLATWRTVTARVLSLLGAMMRSRRGLACLDSRRGWWSLGCTCCEELRVCNNKLEYLYILYIILKEACSKMSSFCAAVWCLQRC